MQFITVFVGEAVSFTWMYNPSIQTTWPVLAGQIQQVWLTSMRFKMQNTNKCILRVHPNMEKVLNHIWRLKCRKYTMLFLHFDYSFYLFNTQVHMTTPSRPVVKLSFWNVHNKRALSSFIMCYFLLQCTFSNCVHFPCPS